MKYPWIDDYMLAKPAVEKDLKEEWNNATRYLIAGKMIAMQTHDKEGEPILTLKGDPITNEILRQEYKDIIAGYYTNKQHWNSVYLKGDVPDDVLKKMCDEAYDILLESFSKKKQKEILEKT